MQSNAFSWPFDGDPLNCCQAARLSRRGWESQVVAGGWLGRGGEGDAGGGKGAATAFLSLAPIAPSQWTRACENTCMQNHSSHVSGGMSVPHVCVCDVQRRNAILGAPVKVSGRCNGKKLEKGNGRLT